ncbi:MAG: hypothetical protein M4579_005780 [Chaenotheca gracillima]|nr:MAG: hypothetical protein M4579_005780 [Chaenotheca gracillima]
MRSLSIAQAATPLVLLVAAVRGQGLSSIPPCYQNCITNSGDFTCNGIDLPCICRLSNGNFLTDVITCIHSKCDNQLNPNDLLQPLALGCSLVGSPISPQALNNAQDAGSPTTTARITGATTRTSTFASAGTTFLVGIPVRISTNSDGNRRTVTGPKITAIAPVTTRSGSRTTSSTSSRRTSATASNTRSAKSSGASSDAATSQSASSASSTGASSLAGAFSSSASAALTSATGQDSQSSTPSSSSTAPAPSNPNVDGTPFQSSGANWDKSSLGVFPLVACLTLLASFAAMLT